MEDLRLGNIYMMIYDKFKNISRYGILKQIDEFNLKDYQKGKFDIKDETFFGIGLEYNTKSDSECLWEAHQKYLDIF